jgi:hypothetical protein
VPERKRCSYSVPSRLHPAQEAKQRSAQDLALPSGLQLLEVVNAIAAATPGFTKDSFKELVTRYNEGMAEAEHHLHFSVKSGNLFLPAPYMRQCIHVVVNPIVDHLAERLFSPTAPLPITVPVKAVLLVGGLANSPILIDVRPAGLGRGGGRCCDELL